MGKENVKAVEGKVTDVKKDGKNCIRVRGTATIYDDQSFEFVSQKEGKPKQKDVKKYGDAKVHTTTGANPKRVITLECSADAADPAAELSAQFGEIYKSEFQRNMPKELEPTGIVLKNEADCKVTVNKKTHTLEVSFKIDLKPEGLKDYKTKFYERIQDLSKCFVINENIIRKSK